MSGSLVRKYFKNPNPPYSVRSAALSIQNYLAHIYIFAKLQRSKYNAEDCRLPASLFAPLTWKQKKNHPKKGSSF